MFRDVARRPGSDEFSTPCINPVEPVCRTVQEKRVAGKLKRYPAHLGCQLLSNTVISLGVTETVITPCYCDYCDYCFFLSNRVVTVPLLRVLLVTVKVTKIQ
jgi:hypothetical protein